MFSNVQGIAVEEGSGDVFVYDVGAEKIYKFGPSGEPLAFSGLGSSNAIEGIGGNFEPASQQIAVAPPGSPGGTAGDIYVANNSNSVVVYGASGARLGQLEIGAETCGVATNGAGALFVDSFGAQVVVHEFVPSTNPPEPSDEMAATAAALPETCNVAVDGAGAVYATNYQGAEIARLEAIGSPVATSLTPGAFSIAADPVTNTLLADRGELVAEYGPDGTLVTTFGSGELNESVGLAINPVSEKVYVADEGTGTVKVFGPVVVVPEVRTDPASEVTPATAELRGTVTPEGLPLDECKFEYGLVTETGFSGESPCVPPIADIPPNSSNFAVHASLGGLRPNTTYRFRLTAGNTQGVGNGQPETFTTTGPPLLGEFGASEATETSATLEATVDPRGFGTSYEFEWGPTSDYGNTVGAGAIPVGGPARRVHASILGLDPGTSYHYRLVATSLAGRAASPDQEVESLDTCGLADGRCFELVSPKEPGPVATAGNTGPRQLSFQGAESGPGSLAYAIEYGLPSANRGAEVLYRDDRSAVGWNVEQLSPGVTAQNTKPSDAGADQFLSMSNDLSCSVLVSSQPLTSDPAVRALYEEGREILYRRNAAGTYTAITNLVPTNFQTTVFSPSNAYTIVGMSQDCNTVVFESGSRIPWGAGHSSRQSWRQRTKISV